MLRRLLLGFLQLQASQEQERTSSSGRDAEPQGVGINNVLLALAAAYVLPGPLFPLAALTLPLWLSGKSRRRSRSSASPSDVQPEATDSGDIDWMSGGQLQQQTGFGFSEGPAQDTKAATASCATAAEDQEEHMRQRRQQQMAALQQQQMFNMMRMMGGGIMGSYRGGFGGPFGIRGGFRRGPFMF